MIQALRVWKSKDDDAKRTIEIKRQELEAKGVRLNMAFIQRLTDDEAKQKKTLDALYKWREHLTDLKTKHARALEARWNARNHVAALRAAYAKTANETLRRSLTDLHVSLKFLADAHAPEAADLIQRVMGWRTNQVPRARLITQKLTVPKLLQALENLDEKALTKLVDNNGVSFIDAQDAAELLKRFSVTELRHELERCPIHDLPQLVVTKRVERNGKIEHVTRPFSKMSLGQQQSILLTLLLSSNGNNPLIIDQPEDNLDGEFIYGSFVPVLRRAKERRQIIIVTHNANIAVLGDAEQIVVLKANNDHAVITTHGSIDDVETSKSACNILEGSRVAFERRAKMYRIK